MKTIHVKIFSDFVWPFCYIGNGIVEELKKEFPLHDEWLPYELRPETPPEGIAFTTLFPGADLAARLANLQRAGAPYGIVFGERTRTSNSRSALEAAEYARDQGLYHGFHVRVFRAYFTEALDIGDLDVLCTLGEQVGLDAGSLRAALADGLYAPRIHAARQEAEQYGVTAVPTFIIDNREKIVGAQDLTAFRAHFKALQDIWARPRAVSVKLSEIFSARLILAFPLCRSYVIGGNRIQVLGCK